MQLSNKIELTTEVRSRNAPWLLLALVVLSVLLHGSTILFPSAEEHAVFTPRIGTTIVSTLLRPTNNAPATPPSQAVAPKEIKLIPKDHQRLSNKKTDTAMVSLKPSPTLSQQQEEVRPQKFSPASTTTSNKAIAAENPVSVQQQRNYLLGELQNRLSQYLIYPMRARRRGWQGEVLLAFRINERGQLGAVRLARSSGYSLLDHSALSAMSKMKAIDIPETLGPAQAMNLQLPVHYRLQEG